MTDSPSTADADPLEEAPPLDFRRRQDSEADELDMTPMVDVTFLLLIFFMVTAAYSLQKSISVPAPDQSESATQSQTIEQLEEDDYVIVEIHSDDTVFVNRSMAPSEQELLIRLREAREGGPGGSSGVGSNLLVLANPDSHHETVVMVLDAGNAVGMENVRLATSDETGY